MDAQATTVGRGAATPRCRGVETLLSSGEAARAHRLAGRHLLGLGVLLLTMVSAYTASGTTGVRETPRATDAPRPAGFPDRSQSNSAILGVDSHIKHVAARYGMSENLIAAIIEAESQYNPRAISPRGAQGLMQLMPKTAAILRVADPFDPRENIDGGVRHLRSLMVRFDNNLPLVLAAYNAGAHAVIRHGGVPPYRETRQYVSRILRRLDRDGTKISDVDQRGRKI